MVVLKLFHELKTREVKVKIEAEIIYLRRVKGCTQAYIKLTLKEK